MMPKLMNFLEEFNKEDSNLPSLSMVSDVQASTVSLRIPSFESAQRPFSTFIYALASKLESRSGCPEFVAHSVKFVN